MEAHLEDLRDEVHDAELVEAIRRGWREASLPDRTRALLEFGEQAAKEAHKTSREDVHRLREQGLSDEEIVDAASVVALFSFFNVIADSLGVDPEPEWSDPS